MTIQKGMDNQSLLKITSKSIIGNTKRSTFSVFLAITTLQLDNTMQVEKIYPLSLELKIEQKSTLDF